LTAKVLTPRYIGLPSIAKLRMLLTPARRTPVDLQNVMPADGTNRCLFSRKEFGISRFNGGS
jgi:hypothetical protein